MKHLARFQLGLLAGVVALGALASRAHSTTPLWVPLVWTAVGAYALGALLLWPLGRSGVAAFARTQATALAAALLTLAGGAYVLRPRAAPTPVRADEEGALGSVLKLERWSWHEEADGRVRVSAELLPGAAGTVALDARAVNGLDEDLWVPEVVPGKLERTPVVAGAPVHVERWLRRVQDGADPAVVLRFSYRPAGPQGPAGVIAYASRRAAPLLEGTRDVVRPLPPPAP